MVWRNRSDRRCLLTSRMNVGPERRKPEQKIIMVLDSLQCWVAMTSIGHSIVPQRAPSKFKLRHYLILTFPNRREKRWLTSAQGLGRFKTFRQKRVKLRETVNEPFFDFDYARIAAISG
jgi:hypothetical protein